jgi:hypothetical protein
VPPADGPLVRRLTVTRDHGGGGAGPSLAEPPDGKPSPVCLPDPNPVSLESHRLDRRAPVLCPSSRRATVSDGLTQAVDTADRRAVRAGQAVLRCPVAGVEFEPT